jgi:Flp pilus assembly protein TadG
MAAPLPRSVRRLAATVLAFGGSRKGNVALLFALLTPVVVGGAGLATEVGYWYHRRLELQSAADAAAYAAAVDLRSGANQTAFTAEAVAAAQKNGFDPAQGTITVNWPPKSGTHQTTQSIEVLISENTPRFFSQLFVKTALIENVRSVTLFQNAATACMTALDPSASGAALFSGSSSVTLVGCSVMANSLSSSAIVSQGSALLSTDCIISVGGVSLTAGVSETVCGAPITQAPPVADPFSDVPTPSTTGPCQSTSGSTLQPGVYCNGLTLQGNVTLAPGVYVINGDDLKVNANANVVGDGVTIYMVGNNQVRMNGTATVKLSAPTSGTYSGMLMMGDHNGANVNETLDGTADSLLTGAIYFPTQNVNYIGNFSGTNGCTQVVADTISFNGHAEFSANCLGYGMHNLAAYEAVRFVE